MNKAGNCQSINGLCPVNRMSTGYDDTCFVGFIISTPQNFLYRLFTHGFRNAHYIECQLRLSTHGIHVTQRICRCNLPIQKGIIHDRGKEICCLDEGYFLRHLIYAGVITFIISHQKLLILMGLKALQHLYQCSCTNLCPTPCASG